MSDGSHDSSTTDHVRRARPLRVLAWGLLVAALLTWVDWPISQWSRFHELPGDVRREIELLQQFGSVGSMMVVAAVILLVDRARFRRLLDWGLAYAITGLVVLALKALIGRPRPVLLRPVLAPGGFTEQPVTPDGRTGRAIELGGDYVERLWSMPSSHTSGAVVLGVYLALVYPRLRWFALAMVVIVALGRVMLWAHYPSDVVVGGAIAFAISYPLIRCYAGVGLVDAIWQAWVDRDATPALPRMRALRADNR